MPPGWKSPPPLRPDALGCAHQHLPRQGQQAAFEHGLGLARPSLLLVVEQVLSRELWRAVVDSGKELLHASGVRASLTAELGTRVTLDDIAGITGTLSATLDADYHPTAQPAATLNASIRYELGGCLLCWWKGSPARITLASGTIWQRRLASGAAKPASVRLLDWSGTGTVNRETQITLFVFTFVVDGTAPIASYADFQQGKPYSNFNWQCEDPITGALGGSGWMAAPFADDLISTEGTKRTFRREFNAYGVFSGICHATIIDLVALDGSGQHYPTKEAISAAGLQDEFPVLTG